MKHRKRALVLLHGFMGSAADWHPIASVFGERFDVHSLDLPGHGRTPLPSGSLTMDAVVAWLEEETERRAIDRFILVGYSMGGRVALHYALQYPDRCTRLVLVSASPGIRDPAERVRRAAADDAWADKLERMDREVFLREWYDQPVFRSLERRPEVREALIRSKRAIDNRAAAQVLRALSPGCTSPLWDRLEQLAVPTLAIVGALDGKYVDVARDMSVLSSHVQTGIIPDAGHVVHAEREPTFLQEMGGFVGYLPPTNPKSEPQ